MTREEAERVAARLVTMGSPSIASVMADHHVVVCGHKVHSERSRMRAEEIAADERAAIVRMLMDVGSEATSPGITEAISPTRFELAAQVCELMLQNATAAAWEKLLEWKKGAVDGR